MFMFSKIRKLVIGEEVDGVCYTGIGDLWRRIILSRASDEA